MTDLSPVQLPLLGNWMGDGLFARGTCQRVGDTEHQSSVKVGFEGRAAEQRLAAAVYSSASGGAVPPEI